MNLRKAIAISLLSFGFMASPMTVAYAEQQTIEATGSYTMQDGTETISDAQEKARKEAMRLIVEKAGVYIESYSKTENLTLTADQVRVIAGQIIKIEKDEMRPIVSEGGKSISYVCSMRAIVDTDKIDLQRAMETKKVSEQNAKYKDDIQALQSENERLRKKYIETQQESTRAELLRQIQQNTSALNQAYKNSIGIETYIDDLNAASNSALQVGDFYLGMPIDEIQRLIPNKMAKAGWSAKYNLSGAVYTRIIPSNDGQSIAEKFSYTAFKDDGVRDFSVTFSTNSKIAAELMYKIAATNFATITGIPYSSGNSLENTHSIWDINDGAAHIQLNLGESKSGSYKYHVSIMREVNTVGKWNLKHHPMDMKYVTKFLRMCIGEWYDQNGNRVLSISENTINGCNVLAGFDFAGGGINSSGYFRILEKSAAVYNF